ncbi:hypothetical protein EHR10_18425 [Leptospira yasudae]|nr:hypothetical protein EHR10_18425 [Leptospira yasudae]
MIFHLQRVLQYRGSLCQKDQAAKTCRGFGTASYRMEIERVSFICSILNARNPIILREPAK